MTALVVDSSDMMRYILRRILSMRGFDVEEARDAQQAQGILHRIGEADVVLVDWDPSAMDSLQLVSHLRKHSTLVIMMLSAQPGVREMQDALSAGANDFLVKPFNSMQITKKLASAGFAA